MATFQATTSPTPFGIFDSEKDFIIDANSMVTFVKRKLGDDILSVELTNKQVWKRKHRQKKASMTIDGRMKNFVSGF